MRASEDELLDAAWDDAPAAVRPFAAITLRAHLEKLREEGRLTAGLSRSRPSSSAASSGVVPEAAALSKIVRSVSPTARTRVSARPAS